jgi:zinc transport system substrate-binding protein
MRHYTIYIICLLCLLIIGVQPGLTSDRVAVFVSVVPQKYFVQQIGKDLVDVQVMVQPGASPATYEPKPRQMAGISRAQAYFAIGVPFEKAWLKKIAAANDKMKVVHTDQGIEKIPMATHHHHHEGEGGGHKEDPNQDAHDQDGHCEPDPHIWLSPPLVKTQARTILTALLEIDPSHGAAYQRNYEQFMSAIDELHAHLKNTFADCQGTKFMVFHPAWGYFAHTYGIEEVPIGVEGKAPKPAQLKALIEQARGQGIRMVFVQPQFSTKSAELVAREIGGRVAVANPLAEDWMNNLRHISEKFKAALK